MRITRQSQVQAAPPGRRKSDGQPCTGRHNAGPSLYLVVAKDGRHRRWAFRYRRPSTGKVTEHGLGSADLLTLAEARDKVHDCRRDVAKGDDPIEKRREERRKGITFGEMANAFVDVMIPVWRSQKHADNMQRLLNNHASALASKNIGTITIDDIETVLRPVWTQSPDQGKRTLSAVSQVFDYARSYQHCTGNPAEWKLLQRRFPSRHKVTHFRAPDYSTIPDLVHRLHIEQQRGNVLSAFAIEFLLLTAGRLTEVCRMRWNETNFETKVWTVPAERMKAGREHRVPLVDRALALLSQQPKKSEYVWTNRKGSPISGKGLYLLLTKTLGMPFTLHGLRSAFRDWAGCETSFDRLTCELALAHRAGDQTELAYKRSDELARRRLLMEAWARFCYGLDT
jgi:integrase